MFDVIGFMESMNYKRFPVILNHCHLARVVAGLVPATSILVALCSDARDGRDKPGHDAE